jgi:signal peptidase
MIKTFEQITREFMEENNLIKKETPPTDICGDIERQIAELDDYLKFADLNNPHIKEADALLSSINIEEPGIVKEDEKTDHPRYMPMENVIERLRRAEQERKKKRRKILKRATDILLYITIAFIMLLILVLNGTSNKKFSIFGYSGFTVISNSMQSEIPEGSFVLVKKIDPGDINVGDDIAFIRKRDNSALTHRVIDVYENYGETSETGFQTQGVDNAEPDPDIIFADDIVGIVKLTVPGLGATLNYISVNIGVFLVIIGGLFAIVIITRKLILSNKKQKTA